MKDLVLEYLRNLLEMRKKNILVEILSPRQRRIDVMKRIHFPHLHFSCLSLNLQQLFAWSKKNATHSKFTMPGAGAFQC